MVAFMSLRCQILTLQILLNMIDHYNQRTGTRHHGKRCQGSIPCYVPNAEKSVIVVVAGLEKKTFF